MASNCQSPRVESGSMWISDLKVSAFKNKSINTLQDCVLSDLKDRPGVRVVG